MISKRDFVDKYLKHLNEKQLEAVLTVEGPILLLAVPGSGKTTVLVNRLGYMIYCAGIDPENILTLTYTISATKDMSNRFENIFGSELHERLEFRTINGICSKIINRFGKMIGQEPFSLVTDEGVLARLLTDILKTKLDEYPTESEIKGVKSLITYCKNMVLTEEEIQKIGEEQGLPLLETYREYNEYLKKNHLMDYDDQMVYGYLLLTKSPELLSYYREKYRYICVDEAQDTSKIQHMIIKLLAGENGNLFMVGDEDQSIYGFRAAYPEALLSFEEDHPGARVLVMDQNYRSNAKIVAAADAFIQHNKARHEKHMVSVREARSEIRYVDLKKRAGQYSYLLKVAEDCKTQTAVLYRDNDSALPLVDQMERQQIPYWIKGVDMAFFTNRIVTDVTSILQLALDPYNTDLFMRIYYKCQTYLRKYQAERMCQVSREKHIPILEAAERVDGIGAMVKGKCRGMATNLKSMRNEAPAKAIFRIENPMGYLDYLDRNNIDPGKLYILKQLAYSEDSVKGFLSRLDYLRDLLKNGAGKYGCSFILSTIHSSKGLEYDRVYLMDVFDGQFPVTVPRQGASEPKDWATFEEERRLFYVGMTRAKNELIIFRHEEASSQFVRELTGAPSEWISIKSPMKIGFVPPEEKPVQEVKVTEKKTDTDIDPSRLKSDFVLVIGERIKQKYYGSGVIDDVDYDEGGKAKRFTVKFDEGDERKFAFPAAFQDGLMELESGEKVEITVEEVKPVKQTGRGIWIHRVEGKQKKTEKDSYSYWTKNYPDYIVIKKEGAFWTCRGDSARLASFLLGYKLGGGETNPVTGSPYLEPMIAGLKQNEQKYIVVENGEIIAQMDYN